MKKVLTLVIVVLGFTNVVLAKKGGSNPDKLIIQNSAAGFLDESLEHSLRLLSNTDSSKLDLVKDIELATITADQTKVTLYMQDTSVIQFNCSKFIDYSNGGTVTKNEAFCEMQ